MSAYQTMQPSPALRGGLAISTVQNFVTVIYAMEPRASVEQVTDVRHGIHQKKVNDIHAKVDGGQPMAFCSKDAFHGCAAQSYDDKLSGDIPPRGTGLSFGAPSPLFHVPF